MLPEEENSFLDKIRELSTEELEKEQAVRRWGSSNGPDNRKYNLVELVLSERRKREEENRFDKTLRIAGDNVIATRRLVWATVGLVFVTALLALITFLKK